MAPSRPRASRSLPRRTDTHFNQVEQEQQYQQAGRAGINLAAQRSAQSLREATRQHHRSPTHYHSEPALSRNRRANATAPGPATVYTRPRQRYLQPPRPNIRAPAQFHQPPISSPLNPTALALDSNSEESVRSQHGPLADNALGSSSRGDAILAPPVVTNEAHLESRKNITNRPGLSKKTSSVESQASHPRSIRDLGSDYTRYFILPSYYSESSPEPGKLSSGSDVDTPKLDKRASNPFRDSKHLSNPFASHKDISSPSLRPEATSSAHEDSQAIPAMSQVPGKSPTPGFIAAVDPEKAGFFQYMDDRFGAPGFNFPLITDMKEDDDDLHMPMWDDDKRLRPKLRDHFTRENIISTIGLFFMVVGLLSVFVILPIISYTGEELLNYGDETPPDEIGAPPYDGPSWAHVNDRVYPLLRNVRTGLIDPDTPADAMTRVGVDGDELKLVFSDEFNEKNRTFYPGDEAYWYGFEGWYGATNDLEWYDPDALNTGDGTLLIQMDQFTSHNLSFRSGMLHSWNHLCFKGSIFEVSVSLPGPAGVHGLWPGMWTMGNLGRPGYLATTDGMWPYTYNTCDSGITPNQSMTDGTSLLPGQRLPSCSCAGSDHPTPGKGRGAPEIDIAEVSADWGGEGIGVATQSYQVAPFDVWYYPNYDFMANPHYEFSYVNTYTGGPYQQAVSTTTMLNNSWYDGEAYQKFAFEYVPGNTSDAFVAWTVSDEVMMRFDARAIGPNGNIGQREISQEPMSMILNLGISNNWVDIEWGLLKFPTVLRVDYVRWYQRPGHEMVTCDPPGYETTEYIAKHPKAYWDVNATLWSETGYEWPTNEYMHGCGG